MNFRENLKEVKTQNHKKPYHNLGFFKLSINSEGVTPECSLKILLNVDC